MSGAGARWRTGLAAIAGVLLAPALSVAQADPKPDIVAVVSAHIATCWAVPIVGTAVPDIVFRLRLSRDGALDGPPVLLEPPEGKAPAVVVESVRRAILRCSPYADLRQYDAAYPDWKELILRFKVPVL